MNRTFFSVGEYIRLSREDGDKAESDSIVNQKKLLSDYIKKQEAFVVYDIYVDDGFSGTNYNRPAFQRMIGDIENGKVDCVIVKDLSRFGRDYIETGRYLERYFPERNIRFISVTDHIDSFVQAYDMLLPIKNIFNEQYARDISRKIHASIQTRQQAGEFIGAFASYGYRKSPSDKNKLVIDEYAADVVRSIFDLYNKGYGKPRNAGILNEKGILCPSAYKNANGESYRNASRPGTPFFWSYSTVSRILQNEMYIGNMVQGRKNQHMRGKAKSVPRKDWVIVQGTHEPIIDINTWQKTQELLQRRMRNLDLASSPSALAGFLKCGDCGRALVKKTGSSDICYYCGSYVRSGRQCCTPHKISYKILEHILLDDLNAILHSMNNLSHFIQMQQNDSAVICHDYQSEKKRIQTELERTQKLKKAVYEDYREELLSKEDFLAYRQDYAHKEELLDKQLASLNQKEYSDKAPDIEDIPWFRHLLTYHRIESLDREIAAAMLHEIIVYENCKIKIRYCFSDERTDLHR